ncbi:MAG: hypothetical protein OSB68_08920 [Dehalococcoidia bacterium]|nr:hypothetical protein [Dehalococcoidia bacterium]
MLGRDAGQLDVRSMIEVLTDHSDGENPDEDRVVDLAGNLSICLHRTIGDSTGASTASLVADLCVTDERLPIYWTGLYSPCMTVFLPNFIEGELPGVLGIGGELESADSPWWDFYRLTQLGVRAGVEARVEIRSELANLQNELFESAYEVAKTGLEMIGNGAVDAAAEMLTKYMAENAQRVILKVKSMVPTIAPVS